MAPEEASSFSFEGRSRVDPLGEAVNRFLRQPFGPKRHVRLGDVRYGFVEFCCPSRGPVSITLPFSPPASTASRVERLRPEALVSGEWHFRQVLSKSGCTLSLKSFLPP